MWAGMLHLVFGNALIGLGEGLLLARLFSLAKRQSVVWVMIVANYASAWLGGLLIREAVVQALPLDLNNGWRWFWCMVVLTYVMTLIIEWPFVAWCFRGRKNWLKQTLWASLIIQSVSYIVLFAWYWMASGTSLYTKMEIVAPADLALPASVLVYSIGPVDGNVYKQRLTGSERENIYVLNSKDHNDRLFARPSSSDTNHWDLVARLEGENRRYPRFVEVLTNLLIEAAPDRSSGHTNAPHYNGTWFNFGAVQSLGSATNSRWECWSGFWSVEGLRASDKTTGQLVRFSYETPFGAWRVRNAVHLPSDKVLFQLGDDQICVFDPATRRVALLWHGRGPVAVIEKGRSAENENGMKASGSDTSKD
jgi:hypothetical protein